ncbi:MAG: ribonuclease R [Burkholderiales bacterium]
MQESKDPWFERESKKYSEPIPSREFILDNLASLGVPVDEDTLAARLKIKSTQRQAFAKRLAAMTREGQLLRNRKDALLVAQKLDLIAGRVIGHPDGFGFLVPDAGGDDLFISPHEMRKLMHGDRAMVRPEGYDRRGRREGVIVEVTERAHTQLVGKLHRDRDFLLVTPSDRRIKHEILIAQKDSAGAKSGQVVVVKILSHPAADPHGGNQYSPPVGRIEEILGNATDPGMEIEIALRKHDLPFEFSSKALALANRHSKEVRESDWHGREDIRDLPLVTIDGETARDFDDAVYCRRDGKGFKLLVAIADVSHYVLPQDTLDGEARERGNSVYFPRRVIPMLPESLSNGLCSLNPEVDRLCMVCEMAVGATGAVKNYRFFAGVMRSHARLTYTRAAAALADKQGPLAVELGALMPHLSCLEEVYRVLAKTRAKRGAIDFETQETQFVFNDKSVVERIERVQRNDAHRLIEECMLAANVCAANFLQENEHPALYRVHQGPTPEKLKALREFLKGFGLQLGGGEKPRPLDYAALLTSVKDRPDIGLLQTVMLRSLRQAVYSPENEGHFGLAYEAYAHFTSPIRRYPDLLVHRSIKAILERTKYSGIKWEEVGRHCSETERRADEATREVDAWLKCHYVRDRVGEDFAGTITAATGFGIFVGLDDLFVEGLVHVSELGKDYFQFDATRHQLLGERTGQRFRVGDKLRVKVARVDLESSRIELVLA